jgi:DNA-binding CsgD family transcriptional regulator
MTDRESDPVLQRGAGQREPSGESSGSWGFDAAARLLDEARDSVAWVPPATLGAPARRDVSATAARLALLARRGLRVRVLCPDEVAGQQEYLALLDGFPSLAPRLSRHAWPEQLMVDERAAMLRARVGGRTAHGATGGVANGTASRTAPGAAGGTAGGAPGSPDVALVVRAQPVVTTLAAVFHAEWDAAVPLPEPVPDESRLASEPARRILDLLGAGYRDAAAASELGLSIRTYRRHVAELMSELSADSRFQAGVRAAHLGLLPRDPESAA